MKLRSILALLLIAIVLYLNPSEARSSGGSRGGGSRGGSRGGGSRTGGSSGGSRKVTTTTVRRRNANGTYSSFSGARVYGSYIPFGGHVLIVGTPYYDMHYRYYYDGATTYQEHHTNPVAAVIITIIVIAICCLCCYIASKNNLTDEEYYQDEEITTTTVVEHYDGPPAQVYAQGTNPPGTALCNSGHIFAFLNTNPYPGDTATCDNCQQIINWYTGGYHCEPCEVDLCANCGMGRVKPAGPPGGFPQQQYPTQGMPPAGPPQGFPQQQQFGQPGGFPPQQQFAPPGGFPQQQQFAPQGGFPPQQQYQQPNF